MRNTETWLMDFMPYVEKERKNLDITTNCPRLYHPEIVERMIVVMKGLSSLLLWYNDQANYNIESYPNQSVPETVTVLTESLNALCVHFGITCEDNIPKSLKQHEIDVVAHEKHIRDWCGVPEDTEILTIKL